MGSGSLSHNISGEWEGEFAYPASEGPVTPFLANITQSGNGFSGTIIEPDLYSTRAPAEATIIGVLAGNAVDFTKTYRSASRGYENPVDYVGQLVDDGERITGVWSLLDFNGTFEMTRRGVAAAQVEREAEEAVKL